METQTLWTVAVVATFAVAGVVALLLVLIINTARDIDSVAAEIWTVGKRVANNTVHIPLLVPVAASVDNIGAAAPAILGAAQRIRRVLAPAAVTHTGPKA